MRAFEILNERSWLNELKEYLDLNYYGSWLHGDGTIEYIDDAESGHEQWVLDTYGSNDYYKAYNDGWIRIISEPTMFQMNGYASDIKMAFKYWWPSAIKTDKLWIETEDNNEWYEYEMPKDRIKLQQNFGPQQ